MTSLTDKTLSKLHKIYDTEGNPYIPLASCLALAKAEAATLPITTGSANLSVILGWKEANGIGAAVVGDWEREFEKFVDADEYVGNIHRDTEASEIKQFITNLLAAKNREIVEANKKGFIDGALSK